MFPHLLRCLQHLLEEISCDFPKIDSSWLQLTRVDSIHLYWVYILVGGPTASYISSNWFYTVGSLICIKSRGVVNYAKHGWAPFISSSHGWSFTKFVPIGGIKSRYRKMHVWQFEYIFFNCTKHTPKYILIYQYIRQLWPWSFMPVTEKSSLLFSSCHLELVI